MPTVPNTVVTIYGKSNEFGAKVEYRCMKGFQISSLNGTMNQTTCGLDQSTGSLGWTGTDQLFSCIPLYCESPPIIENAMKISNSEQPIYWTNSKEEYQCIDGYTFDVLNSLQATITCISSEEDQEGKWSPRQIKCIRKLIFDFLLSRALSFHLIRYFSIFSRIQIDQTFYK